MVKTLTVVLSVGNVHTLTVVWHLLGDLDAPARRSPHVYASTFYVILVLLPPREKKNNSSNGY